MTTTITFTTSGTWTVPNDFNPTNNTGHVIGGGAGGFGVIGGNGAWYAQKTNMPFIPTQVVSITVGNGSNAAVTTILPGGDSWVYNTSFLVAPGGGSSTTPVGNITNAGGPGGISGGAGGGSGGGGAGGPNGPGQPGQANGAFAPYGGAGGAGDNGFGGAGGAGAQAGGTSFGGNIGQEFGTNLGSGGGGGGGQTSFWGGAGGGSYGGGGGGGASGAAASTGGSGNGGGGGGGGSGSGGGSGGGD